MDEPPRSCLQIKRTVRYENLFAEIEETPVRYVFASGGPIRLRL